MNLAQLVSRMAAAGGCVKMFEAGQPRVRTYREIHDAVTKLQRRLQAAGVREGARVGILARNSVDFIVLDLALVEIGAVSVVFTEDFFGADVAGLVEARNLQVLFADRDFLPGRHVAHVFALGDEAAQISIREPCSNHALPKDTHTLAFSSGSAGGLKGVCVKRGGMEASIASVMAVLPVARGDSMLVFLPLSNFQQRLMIYSAIWFDIDVVLADPPSLFRAIGQYGPSIIIAPPMLYELVEAQFANLSAPRRVALRALGRMLGLFPRAPFRDRIFRTLFPRAYEQFGGGVKYLVTGMAPIKRSTLALYRDMGLPMFQVYGLLEFGMVAANSPRANRLGSVGRVLPGVALAFRDDGEIVARRAQALASGYFECAEGEGEKTFVSDGAVATGDIGYLDADGYLFLRGRKKEIIVTRGGKKIHPEAIESQLASCEAVSRAVVFPASGADGLVAVIVPVHAADEARGRLHVQGYVEKLNSANAGVPIRRVVFCTQGFSRENGFLRPNLKLDRPAIERHFRDQAAA